MGKTLQTVFYDFKKFSCSNESFSQYYYNVCIHNHMTIIKLKSLIQLHKSAKKMFIQADKSKVDKCSSN